jgi:hypothetical protein
MPSWDEITEAELKQFFADHICDAEIARLYSVSKSKVRYKREMLGITEKNYRLKEFSEKRGDLYTRENDNAKRRLLNKDNIDQLSKAIANYLFRSGPIEDMHANNQLSEEDMKTLNVYMVNRIAGLLTAVADNSWLQLERLLLTLYKLYGTEWDPAEPDMYEINEVFKDFISAISEKKTNMF